MTKPPNGRSTIRLLQFRRLLDDCRRALVIVSYPILIYPPTVSPSHRLPLLAYFKTFGQPLCYSARTSYTCRPPPLFSLSTRSEMSLPTASVAAPPIRNECNAISSGLRRDFATTSFTARRARPHFTTLRGLLSHDSYGTT